MTTPIPALVVGTGFGCRVHVPALRAAGFDVVGLVGATPERLAKRAAQAGIERRFADLDEAIDATGAGVVTIATPPDTHARLALAAIARGCHVLCEKPFAFDTGEAQTMLDAAEAAGVVHMVAHEFRWMPDRALFGRAIAEGLIGEPRFLVLDQFLPFLADPATPMPPWWFEASAGGGWLGAAGSHLLDQVRVWLGEIESVSGSLFLVSERQAHADDSYSLRFRLANGVEGSMQQSAGAWGPMTSLWRCMGTHGTVWSEGGKVFLADRQGTRELEPGADLALPPAPEGSRPSPELAPFIRLCAAFRAAIDGRAQAGPVPVPTFSDGLASMRVLDAIRASAAAGGTLTEV